LRTGPFVRLWLAQIVSNVGDWAYVLAVATILAANLGGATLIRSMALLVLVEGLSSALVGLLIAGPIVDRFSRRRVMVVADVGRCLLVASLLLPAVPSSLHLVIVAGGLGAFRSLFQPALMSALPSVVDDDALVTANGIMTGTFHLGIMVGPAIGAALVVAVGTGAAITVNALSFGVSALLLLGLRLPRPTGERGDFSPVADLVDGARYILGSPLARGIALVMGLVLFFCAGLGPFQLALVRDVLAPHGGPSVRTAVYGLMTTTWGSGMVLGSFLTTFCCRRMTKQRLVATTIAVTGAAFAVASVTHSLIPILVAWVFGGVATGILNVSYDTMLQEGTPDRFRGRVFATVESLQDGTYVLGAAAVAIVGGTVAPTTGMLVMGVGLGAIALLARRLISTDGRAVPARPPHSLQQAPGEPVAVPG
ncbi:MAG: MFS transporter, partial [Actinomycetota bacterium]|nr:MFS transporter [Actinomycetota bacterium]